MAKEAINVYNVNILKRHNIHLGSFLVAALFAAAILSPLTTSAQSTLQPTGGSLQPQTGQAQANSSNNLNQTGGVQANNGNQSFLNQSGLRPLGVVSDPNQKTPDGVATPSTSLRTEVINNEKGSSTLPYIALGSLAIVIVGVVYLWRAERKPELVQAGEILIEPEPAPVVKRVKKKSRKKRRQR